MLMGLIFSLLGALQPNISEDTSWKLNPECVPGLVTIDIFGVINSSTVREVDEGIQRIKTNGQPIIPILIDSPGGSVYALLSIIDLLKNANKPIVTIVVGKAMSAAAVLFSFGSGDWRFMSPNSVLMVHQVSSGVEGKTEDIVTDANETLRLNQLLMRMMSENIGKNPTFFDDELRRKGNIDWYITPQEAKAMGFTKHVYIPEFKITITVDTTVR